VAKATKKGRAAATAAATKRKPASKRQAVVEDDDEDEDEEEAPKAKRVAKDYGVTGEDLQTMRDDGMGWQEIMDEVGAKSAIPLRKILVAYQAEQDEDFQIDIDDGDTIVAARDEEGLGWAAIAARAGATVAEVKAAYTEAGGENLEGRAYKSKDGTVHFKIGSTSAASDDDEDEEDEDEDELDEDEDDDEEDEPVVVKKRGRAKAAPAKAPKSVKPAKNRSATKPAPAARPRRRAK